MNIAEGQQRAKENILIAHGARPWNGWDFVWTAAFTLSASTAVTGFMFLHRND